MKNKETGELLDYRPGDPVLEGHQVIKRIYRKRNINVLMQKFRAAAKVAKLIGRMQGPRTKKERQGERHEEAAPAKEVAPKVHEGQVAVKQKAKPFVPQVQVPQQTLGVHKFATRAQAPTP